MQKDLLLSKAKKLGGLICIRQTAANSFEYDNFKWEKAGGLGQNEIGCISKF